MINKFQEQLDRASESKGWSPLANGDLIEVVAPGFGNVENLNRLEDNIISLGFQAKVRADLICTQPLGYSNTEEYRRNHFKSALLVPNSNAIWTLRGGRGTSSLFLKDEEWFCRFSSDHPKLCICFSDFTAVHLYVTQC